MADELRVKLGVDLDIEDAQRQIDSIKNKKDNKITFSADVQKIKETLNQFKNQKTPIRLTLDVNKSASNANITAFRKSIETKFTSNPVKAIIGINKTQSEANIKSFISSIEKQLSNLKVTINPTNISNRATGSTSAGQMPQNNGPSVTGNTHKGSELPYLGQLTTIQILGSDGYQKIQKLNEELGVTRTLIQDIEKDQDTGEEKVTKTVEKITENYEKQAAAAKKANEERQKQYIEMLKANSKQLEFEQKSKEYNKSFASNQYDEILKLESKAFGQDNKLTGKFADAANVAIDAWRNAVKQIESETGKISKSQEDSIKTLKTQAAIAVTEQRKAQYQGHDLTANSFESDYVIAGNKLDEQIAKLRDSGVYVGELKKQFEDLHTSLASVTDQNELSVWNEQLKEAASNAKKLQAEFKADQNIEKFGIHLQKAQNTLDGFETRYKEAFAAHPEFQEELEQLRQKLNNVNQATLGNIIEQIQEFGQRVRNAQNVIDPFVGRASSLSQVLSQNLGGVGQYLARFASMTYIISKVINVTKQMVNEVKELDSSLVELQKVTDLSGNSLSNFTDEAYKIGESLGRTGKDVIDATTTFSRAGYDLQEATELARSALVMSNVGVDIPNIESAASDMISILKAYDKQAEESMGIIDELYNVSNKEPLDFGNLTQMLVTAGGTLAQTGTTIEESMGLLTGAFATLRDTSVANGLTLAHCRSNAA